MRSTLSFQLNIIWITTLIYSIAHVWFDQNCQNFWVNVICKLTLRGWNYRYTPWVVSCSLSAVILLVNDSFTTRSSMWPQSFSSKINTLRKPILTDLVIIGSWISCLWKPHAPVIPSRIPKMQVFVLIQLWYLTNKLNNL